MPKRYSLADKINALNLLDQLDDDFFLVKDQLDIPIKTLRGWRADQDNLRRKFDDRQYQHFANIKHELLNDMLESSRDIMKKIKAGDCEEPASKLAYTLNTLLSNAKKLEDNYVYVAQNPQFPEQHPNRIRFVHHHNLPHPPPRTNRNPQSSRTLQSPRLRTTLGQIGTRKN